MDLENLHATRLLERPKKAKEKSEFRFSTIAEAKIKNRNSEKT
jgi:hypothetical protein